MNDTTTFGHREDAAITDLESAGPASDTHTLMGLTKGLVSLLSDILNAVGESPAMSLTAGSVTVGTTAVQLLAANDARRFCEIRNDDDTIAIYIGGPGVTSSNGYKIAAGQAFGFDDYGGAVYAVAATGTPVAMAIEW